VFEEGSQIARGEEINPLEDPYGQSAWAGKPAGVLGVSVGAESKKFLQNWMDRYVAWVKKNPSDTASSRPDSNAKKIKGALSC